MSQHTKSKHINKYLKQWGQATLLMALILLLAACGGNAAAPESPLDAPQSPLEQPESPLTTTSTEAAVAIPQSRDEAKALVASTAPPPATAGFGSISGLIFSYNLEKIVPGTQFYLTPADEVDGNFVPPSVYFGPQEDGEDVYGFSNEAGQVMLDNIPPGSYYLAVWTVYDWLLAFGDPSESSPLLITIEEGDELNLEMLYVDWP